MKAAKAEVNLTMSNGLRPSPGDPPMVPLIPDIDLIKVITTCLLTRWQK
jgi:hypothetical protein